MKVFLKRTPAGSPPQVSGHPAAAVHQQTQGMIQQMPAVRPPVSLRSPDFRLQRVINIHNHNYQRNSGRASQVSAEISGSVYAPGHNQPTVDPAGWNKLRQHYVMDSQQNIGMRLHLWNGRMGGPGNRIWNLAPCLTDINNAMAQEEVRAQRAVNNGNRVSLTTDVSYNHSTDPQDAAYYYPSHIEFDWDILNANGSISPGGNWNSDTPLPDRIDDDYSEDTSMTDDTIDTQDEELDDY